MAPRVMPRGMVRAGEGVPAPSHSAQGLCPGTALCIRKEEHGEVRI